MMAHPALNQAEQIMREQRRRALEHQIAIEAARSDLECYCERVIIETAGHWYDTAAVTPDDDPAYAEGVGRAVEYLDLCGLLERSAEAHHVVRIRVEALP